MKASCSIVSQIGGALCGLFRLALRRPYTFVVAALLLLLMTPFVITKTTDRYFSRYQHSGRQRDLELHRITGRPNSPTASLQ